MRMDLLDSGYPQVEKDCVIKDGVINKIKSFEVIGFRL
jgi:hypothetical protein